MLHDSVVVTNVHIYTSACARVHITTLEQFIFIFMNIVLSCRRSCVVISRVNLDFGSGSVGILQRKPKKKPLHAEDLTCLRTRFN